jgi:hypothetical protein
MSNTRELYISQAFGEVAQLTELIELSATRDADNADGNTAIEILQSLIISPEDSPEGRGDANEAREKLHALQTVVKLLAAVLQRA